MRNGFTASERRGIITIAIFALLLIGGGVTLSLCGRNEVIEEQIPVVTEHPEMIDSVAFENSHSKTTKKKKASKEKKNNKKTKENYRRRSPLDEPV